MQQAPLRLSQSLWSAFRAAKPSTPHSRHLLSGVQTPSPRWPGPRTPIWAPLRAYSDKGGDLDQKVEDSSSRIEESLDARADAAAQAPQKLKDPQDETIVHTIPESSSIVYTSGGDPQNEAKPAFSPISTPKADPPQPQTSEPDTALPSQSASRYSHLRSRFTDFMDNFQTHIFTASRRLNDLTGYSGIEKLKNEIEQQESVVQASRRAVKAARSTYAEAIATRSTTQREVNDLLHRKHTWSAADLERFTNLYRSDHANEQAEGAAQKDVTDAEARYEEASAKLGKAILARYHEEQIWSDKIRQMSTWGTWGLMGLNVLLFVIFQIAVEPWRRRRLVKGFEEKVELALKGKDDGRMAIVPPLNAAAAGGAEDVIADHLVEQVVDAITGTTDKEAAAEDPAAATPTTTSAVTAASAIEAAADTATSKEIAAEQAPPGQAASDAARWTSPMSAFAWYEDTLRTMFSEDHHILLTQRELTTVALEGVAGGMALMGMLFVLLRPR